MCVPAICSAPNWTPSLKRPYSAPKGGWRIQEIPETLRELVGEKFDTLVWAWHNRPKRRLNSDHNNAVNEMADLFRMNGITVTNEIRGAIRFQADREWCASEPTRCSKQSLQDSMIMTATPIANSPLAAIPKARAKSSTPKRKCCGQK